MEIIFNGDHDDIAEFQMKGQIQLLSDLLKVTYLAGKRKNKIQTQMVRPVNARVVQTSSQGKSDSVFLKMF